ncbi:hypothetical protein FRC02_010960 [Tulasnella sp. 418]|nr:hypothetical protein FRC02_010960 [Tulasnella sp. 418]
MAAGSLIWWLVILATLRSVLCTSTVDIPYNQLSYVGDGEPEWLIEATITPEQQACPHKYTAYSNVSFSYTFTGIGLKLYLPRAANCGNIKLIFDGNISVVDTFNTAWDCTTPVLDLQNLPYGSHTINGSLLRASGAYMNIWKLQYTTLDQQEIASLASYSSAQASNTNTANPGEATGGNSTSKSSTSIGPIIGGVAGGVVVLIIVAVIFYMRHRRSKQRRQNSFDLDSPGDSPPPRVDPWVNPADGQRSTQPSQGYSSQMSERYGPHNYTHTHGSTSHILSEQDHSSASGGGSSNSSQPHKAPLPQYPTQQASTIPQGPDIQNLVHMVAGAVMTQLQQSQSQQQQWQGATNTMQPYPQQPQQNNPGYQPPPSKSTLSSPPPGAAPPRVQSPPLPAYYEHDPLAPSQSRAP